MSNNIEPIKIILAGAGDRGSAYAKFVELNPERAKLVAVAEPRENIRNSLGDTHGIEDGNRYDCWKKLVEQPKMADAVIIAVQDSMHIESAVAFANKGYHILLEKPMATSIEDCNAIINAAKKNNIIFSVCHVLRYTPYTMTLKKLLGQNIIGDLVTVNHVEPVGFWHQSHSFVRGNWKNTDESTFMLLAKSCHDMDWLRYVVNKSCKSLVSFGGLKHFKKENQPKGASDRCLTCEVEPTCPYSARRIYFRLFENGARGWPLTVLTPDVTAENIAHELRTGPYGQCVYSCNNDVVDHQVVTMEFDEQITVNFTMTAFTPNLGRLTHICGTKGHIYGDSKMIHVHDFLSDKTTIYDPEKEMGVVSSGHGGGDFGIMDNFVEAVAKNDPSIILTGPDVTLESHLMVFAAEQSRLSGSIVKL